MRKLFALTAIFFASLGFVFGQTFSNPPCIIAYNDTGLITPFYDSLPCIEKGLPYSSSVQIYIPGTFNSSIILDSLVITSITGLPDSIAYAQNPASGVYYGDSSGCIAFAGTTSNDSGAYKLTFNGYAVITTQSSGTQTYSLQQLVQIQDAPVPVYYLNVINPGDSCFPKPVVEGITDLNLSSQLSIYPNPSTGIFNVELNTGHALNGQMLITDVTGRTVYLEQFDASGLYKSAINLNNCAKGFYLLQLKTTAGVATKSISLQ
jgi:hypothetical protein